MKNYQKYEKSYFMPPEVTYDWAKKDAVETASEVVQRRLKRW